MDTSGLWGSGYILFQWELDGTVNLIHCNSCSSCPSWKNFTPVELVAGGICWALQDMSWYIMGAKKILVYTNHQPLVSIWRAPLHSLLGRMFCLRSQALDYSVELIYVKGMWNGVADCLLRTPKGRLWQRQDLFVGEANPASVAALFFLDNPERFHSDPNYKELLKNAKID